MARYDRIAPLTTPEREQAFPGWLVLRDLEGRERDPELGRRARLRFLALRPVLRLLRHGFDRVSAESFERQIESVREELGHLPARDAERAGLAQYLHAIRQRTPEAVAAATMEMAMLAERNGYPAAAEEYFRTSVAAARAGGLYGPAAAAMVRLGALRARAGDWDASELTLLDAARLALEDGDRGTWASATEGLVHSAIGRGALGEAASRARSLLERGNSWGEEEIAGRGALALAEADLAEARAEAALEHAWYALGHLRRPSDRYRAAARLGAAFARLGLLDAADRAWDLALGEAHDEADRIDARLGPALAAAEAGQPEVFRERRALLLARAAEVRPLPAELAELHLALAAGSRLAGHADLARDHTRDAVAIARRNGLRHVLVRAEALAAENAEPGSGQRRPERSGDAALRIAAALPARRLAAPAGG